MIEVTNSPISATVPVTSPAVMKSPTLKGWKTIKNAPAAKLANSPPQAAPIAIPAAASNAAKEVVSTPKKPRIATTKTILNVMEMIFSK